MPCWDFSPVFRHTFLLFRLLGSGDSLGFVPCWDFSPVFRHTFLLFRLLGSGDVMNFVTYFEVSQALRHTTLFKLLRFLRILWKSLAICHDLIREILDSLTTVVEYHTS